MTTETIEIIASDTPKGTEPARSCTCRHCGMDGLTMMELAAHGRTRKRTGQCLADAPTDQPAGMSQDDRAALDDQIREYAQNLLDRAFLQRSFVSDHGARRIAALVLEDGEALDKAAHTVLLGFAGWAGGEELAA